MEYLKIKNWEEYQHYKDRNPPWIKLHRKILDDRSFMQMPMESRGLLMCLWILAAEENGNIPYDEDEVRFRLRLMDFQITEMDILIERGFLVKTEEIELFESPWPSRYIKPEVKEKAMSRCNYSCVFCGSKENLEYDHIVPTSQGGCSNLSNIQILCRACNRKKRTCVAPATQENPSVAGAVPETETETEAETKAETEVNTSCARTPTPPNGQLSKEQQARFDRFWSAYPKKKSKGQAIKAWKQVKPDESLTVQILNAVDQWKASYDWTKEGGKYIPHPATWLNGMGWEDEPTEVNALPYSETTARNIEVLKNWEPPE